MPETICLKLKNKILKKIETGFSERSFPSLALQVFRHQFHASPDYQKHCKRNGVARPEKINHWRNIPLLPVTAFKYKKISSAKTKPIKYFYTSGTTKNISGKIPVHDLKLHHAAALRHFQTRFPQIKDIPMASLTPSQKNLPHSSLIFMIHLFQKKLGSSNPLFLMDQNSLLWRKIKIFLSNPQPIFLMGTALGFLSFFKKCKNSGTSFPLHPKSFIFETGGLKGKTISIEPKDYVRQFKQFLSLPSSHIISEFGMTELASQYYGIRKSSGKVEYSAPPWARIRCIHPETLKEVPQGTPGLLAHIDLANAEGMMAIRTEDIGIQSDKQGRRFRYLGRPKSAPLRGCSLEAEHLVIES